MSFKFEFKIDYDQLTKLLDAFLKRHADELLGGVIAPSLVLKAGDEPLPEPVTTTSVQEIAPVQKLPVVENPPVSTEDHKVDNKPLIGDELPEDPFQNLFQNSNTDTTRFKDRNNIYNKKGHMLKQ